jgi:hypothetical protein
MGCKCVAAAPAPTFTTCHSWRGTRFLHVAMLYWDFCPCKDRPCCAALQTAVAQWILCCGADSLWSTCCCLSTHCLHPNILLLIQHRCILP